MAVITMPTTLSIAQCSVGQMRYDTTETSDSTGSQSARLLAPPRWTLSITSVDHMTLAEAGVWEAMVIKLRGGVNVLEAFDPVRKFPLGGVVGTLTLASGASAGATSVVVTGVTNGLGVKAGDWLRIGTGLGTSHLCKAVADALPSIGVMTVTIEPPLRIAFSGGASVAVNSPTGFYRMQGTSSRWSYSTQAWQRQGGFALDLIETFS